MTYAENFTLTTLEKNIAKFFNIVANPVPLFTLN
jgi:hypothetical protein